MKRLTQSGFTLIELLIAIVLASILTMTSVAFFSSTFNSYIKLSQDSSQLSQLAQQSQRIAKVLRGLTDIVSLSDNEITVYAYFSPADEFVSQIHYYKNGAGTILYADVTNMTSNPPTGTLITSSTKTFKVIDNFHTVSGTSLFTYLDGGGTAIATPIADQHIVKGIKITLAVPSTDAAAGQYTTTSLQVALRNRKTNL